MLAAILSAIMSTIDSQLLVSSSALTEDFYQKVIKKQASEQEVVFVGRICVIIISLTALFLALRPNDTILGIVAYAWGGFGAAFGPLVLFALFSRKTSWVSALAGMVTGTVVLVIWKNSGLRTQQLLVYRIKIEDLLHADPIHMIRSFLRLWLEKCINDLLTTYMQED